MVNHARRTRYVSGENARARSASRVKHSRARTSAERGLASSYKHRRADPIDARVLVVSLEDAGVYDEADARIRTADPFITSEVLYQLSYVGRGRPV